MWIKATQYNAYFVVINKKVRWLNMRGLARSNKEKGDDKVFNNITINSLLIYTYILGLKALK